MKYLLFLSLVILVSCNDAELQEQLKNAQNEIAEAKEYIKKLKTQIEPEGELVHIVFFKIKNDTDKNTFISEVKKLEGIEEVMDLEIGPYEDLGDARALSEYTHMMSMSFKNAESYTTYQKHPIHLSLKNNTKSFMAGPPATFDFMKK